MTTLNTLSKFFLIILLTAMSNLAYADGGAGPGGGDPYEPKFKDIATNINEWLLSGNAEAITDQLPAPLTFNNYKQAMLNALAHYHISFTDELIKIGGDEKTCKADPATMEIVCNSTKFSSAYKNDIDDVYRCVHHEFATLALIEIPNKQDSDYRVSDKISGLMESEWEWVRRLPVARITFNSESDRCEEVYPKLDVVSDLTLWNTIKSADDSQATKLSQVYKAEVLGYIETMQSRIVEIEKELPKGAKHRDLICYSMSELSSLETETDQNIKHLVQLNHPYRDCFKFSAEDQKLTYSGISALSANFCNKSLGWGVTNMRPGDWRYMQKAMKEDSASLQALVQTLAEYLIRGKP